MKRMKKPFMILIVLVFAFLVIGTFGNSLKASDDPSFSSDSISTYVDNPYENYITSKTQYHKDTYGEKTMYPQVNDIVINASDYYGFGYTTETTEDGKVLVEKIDKDDKRLKSYENLAPNAINQTLVIQEDEGTITWQVDIVESGFYNMMFRYYPIEGYSSAIERAIAINGEVPFDSASAMAFSRIWADSETSYTLDENGNKLFKEDLNGNATKPQQVEKRSFISAYAKDAMGYATENFKFYLEAGTSYISFISVKEPILLDTLTIKSVKEAKTYEQYLAEMETLHGSVSSYPQGLEARVEGENTFTKSSPTLYPATDRSSSKTTPFSYKTTVLNTIGGESWSTVGDWISWNINVPEDGYYKISMRVKQNTVKGMYSTRVVYINDQVLFDELNTIIFPYSNKWYNFTLGDENGDFLIYLNKGVNTIKMEVSLGAYSSLIERIQESIDNLSALYRAIIAYTTVNPDANRDYELDKKFPHMMTQFEEYKNELRAISQAIENISGTKNDKTGVIDAVAVQIEDFLERPGTIPSRLGTFSTNISSLGTILLDLRSAPLEVDYITTHGADVKLPKANAGFFRKIWDGIVSFFVSFFIDYSSIGSIVEDTGSRTIQVWMTAGRDQANVIRNLIDTDFKKSHPDINVELKLTGADVLLKATLAGIGPEVALNVDSTLPVNYGLRNAVLDLTTIPGFWESIYIIPDGSDDFKTAQAQGYENVYMASSIRQYQFSDYTSDDMFDSTSLSSIEHMKENITGVYALPEKQNFLMMFVRDDVLKDLGLEDRIPETWDDVIDLVAELQAEQLQFYLPVNDAGATALNPIFVTMLYQNGGQLYTDDNREAALLSEPAMDAFEYWTEFYTLYSFPKSASFVNRFRTGEMPIGISYYELYNTLSVSAPELKGKWSFHIIPGTERTYIDEQGNEVTYIDHTSTTAGSACVILKEPALKSEQTKMDSWEFLKWWTSAHIQAQFGREMEGILGAAARHNTANVIALQELSWTANELKLLMAQWSHTHEMPNIAGSYMTGREMENAYRQVINNLVNAREVLYEYAHKINNEIDRKRSEFNLPLRGE